MHSMTPQPLSSDTIMAIANDYTNIFHQQHEVEKFFPVTEEALDKVPMELKKSLLEPLHMGGAHASCHASLSGHISSFQILFCPLVLSHLPEQFLPLSSPPDPFVASLHAHA